MVPINALFRRAALRMDSSRNAVVLFPFVPVIPVMLILSAGFL